MTHPLFQNLPYRNSRSGIYAPGAFGAAGLPGVPGAPGAFGAPGAPGTPGIAGAAGSSAPHCGHTVSIAPTVAPHLEHVLSALSAAGLKHIHYPFNTRRKTKATRAQPVAFWNSSSGSTARCSSPLFIFKSNKATASAWRQGFSPDLPSRLS